MTRPAPNAAPTPPPDGRGAAEAAPAGPFQVWVQPAGLWFTAGAGQPLMQAARAAGVVWPRSCQNGSCRACMAQVLQGRVRHLIEWPGLSREELAEGYVLPCVACADSDAVLSCAAATSASNAARGSGLA